MCLQTAKTEKFTTTKLNIFFGIDKKYSINTEPDRTNLPEALQGTSEKSPKFGTIASTSIRSKNHATINLYRSRIRHQKTGSNRPPYHLEIMLRIHIIQPAYNFSAPKMEGYLYEAESMSRFAHLRLYESIPDETKTLNFHHYIEAHWFRKKIFDAIDPHPADMGLYLHEGTIVDATIIAEPTSTKNEAGKRGPAMYQAKKGNEWHDGMKMHIGVDDRSRQIHSITTTSANGHDIT